MAVNNIQYTDHASLLVLSGYEGERCQLPVDHCDSQPCKNGATCFSSQAGPRCYCPEGRKPSLSSWKLSERVAGVTARVSQIHFYILSAYAIYQDRLLDLNPGKH